METHTKAHPPPTVGVERVKKDEIWLLKELMLMDTEWSVCVCVCICAKTRLYILVGSVVYLSHYEDFLTKRNL